jgi:hypothetical protein
MSLLKSYFNIQLNPKNLNIKRSSSRHIRFSTKRIFVGRGEIKHTSSKVIITFYVHNTEKLYLERAIHLVKKALYNPARPLKTYVTRDINNKKIISYNRPLSLDEYSNLPEHYNKWYVNHALRFIKVKNLYLSNLNIQYNILTKMANLKLISEEDKNNTILNLYKNINYFNYPNFSTYMTIVRENYISRLTSLKALLELNNKKFFNPYITELIRLVESFYNKKVEFNIVNLKKMHLNSDIFTQAIALKLKNRKNKLYRVLKSSLRKVNLPKINRITEVFNKTNKDDFFVNKIRNDNISSMFNNDNANDSLNNLLLNFFPDANNIRVNTLKKTSIKQDSISLENYVLKSLKHLNVRGVKIEAKGRITRRLTASRSVFKMKLKGGLKNVDSSFKGLSTIMLRGNFKSNIQHSFISSKNRNGAFGVKG